MIPFDIESKIKSWFGPKLLLISPLPISINSKSVSVLFCFFLNLQTRMESPGAAVNVKCTNRAIINHIISLFSYRRLFSRANHNVASIHPCDKGISFLLILVAFQTRQLDYNVRPCIYFDEKIFYLSSIFFPVR